MSSQTTPCHSEFISESHLYTQLLKQVQHDSGSELLKQVQHDSGSELLKQVQLTWKTVNVLDTNKPVEQ